MTKHNIPKRGCIVKFVGELGDAKRCYGAHMAIPHSHLVSKLPGCVPSYSAMAAAAAAQGTPKFLAQQLAFPPNQSFFQTRISGSSDENVNPFWVACKLYN